MIVSDAADTREMVPVGTDTRASAMVDKGARVVEALAPVLRKELARRRLLDFAEVFPGFESPPHIRHIAGLLEDVERGSLRRLAIAVPVRHGKSVLCSQIFPAWFLGRHPDRDIILASHSEDLAVRNSRIAKNLTQDDRWPFDDVQLASDSTSAGRWNTTRGGGAYAWARSPPARV